MGMLGAWNRDKIRKPKIKTEHIEEDDSDKMSPAKINRILIFPHFWVYIIYLRLLLNVYK